MSDYRDFILFERRYKSSAHSELFRAIDFKKLDSKEGLNCF